MSDEKKTTNKKDKRIKIKYMQILNVAFAVVAVISLVVTILLSPVGDKLFKKEPATQPTTEQETILVTNEPETLHGLPYSEGKYYWPEPTEPTVDPLKNYTVFINVIDFNYKQESGITTVMAKEDISAIMTIKPLPGVEYSSLCSSTADIHGSPVKDKTLERVEISSCYSSEADGYKTVVYCVDDLKGGSVEIKYSCPTTYENSYEERFEFMLTMFELI